MAKKPIIVSRTDNPKPAQAKSKPKAIVSRQADKIFSDVSQADIRSWWPGKRASLIIQIMKDDGISYQRAVKRSRRRAINDGTWEDMSA